LKLNQQFYQARNQLAAQANAAAGAGNTRSASVGSAFVGGNNFSATVRSNLLPRTTTNAPTININGATDMGQTQLAVMNALKGVGLG
jgi:hypothetical protein